MNSNNKIFIKIINIHKETTIMKSNIIKIKMLNITKFIFNKSNNIMHKVIDRTIVISKALSMYNPMMNSYNCKDRGKSRDSVNLEKPCRVQSLLEDQIKPKTLYILTKKERAIVVIITQTLRIKMIKNCLEQRDRLF